MEEDANFGNNFLKIDFIKPIPSDVILVGDAIHNLHTALDLMMCESNPDRNTKFLFFEKRQTWCD